MRRPTTLLVAIAAMAGLTGCGGSPGATPAASVRPTESLTPGAPSTASASTAPAATPPASSPVPRPYDPPDPRWRFYTKDVAWHTSPWFEGAHRVMIGFGCNASPWYAHDTRCPGREGFHHGIDVAMPCGTPIRSAVRGLVVDPTSSGAPGSAYGVHPFRIRTGDHDVLIGHTVDVFVSPGDHVRPGQRIALAGDSGAPDGCHLHFEVRRAGGGLSTAIDPAPYLQLAGD